MKMNAEPVAKLVLIDADDKIVLPYGSSRRLNLPGGGIEPGEHPIDGLARELEEEIGLPLSEVAHLREIGKKRFSVTTGAGEPKRREWNIYSGRTELRADDFMFGEEIQGVASLRRGEIYGSKVLLPSAKIAIILADQAIKQSPLR